VLGVLTSVVLSSIVAMGPPTQVWPYVAGVNVALSVVGLAGALLLKETKNVEL
jgi:hypothetical protein